MTHHIAQYNVARARAELDDPTMAEFVDSLERINALADVSPGFVWRLAGENDDTMDIRPYEDRLVLVTLSVWRSIDDLIGFAYRGDHSSMLRRRSTWFHEPSEPSIALWWIPAGHIPTVEEGKERLEHLRENGATPAAFTFAKRFSMPDEVAEPILREAPQR